MTREKASMNGQPAVLFKESVITVDGMTTVRPSVYSEEAQTVRLLFEIDRQDQVGQPWRYIPGPPIDEERWLHEGLLQSIGGWE